MIWLIGAGPMAADYYNVLKELNHNTLVIGRSEKSAVSFFEKTQKKVVEGGLSNFLNTKPELPDAAIVSVSVEQLAPTALLLLKYGVKKILLEKPGGLNNSEISTIAETAEEKSANVIIAYNRRQYASVLAAKQLIEEDGGVSSFNFEITEWSHVIKNHKKDPRMMNSWFLGNTTHVVDTAFFLGGIPKEINTYTNGYLEWHPASSNYAGSGISESGALFSYHGNWEAPGRWSLEVLTKKNRYIFRPMEELHIQKLGSIQITKYEINDSLDKKFKPGLYLQVSNFLAGNNKDLCNIRNQAKMTAIYEKMAGYK